jgi:glycosyltransferase involved in cell wall biosynthesis
VADFRDLWSQNHFFKHGRVRRAAERTLERTLLRRADALLTVSEPLAAALSELHSRPVTVATNGFEPLQVPRLENDHGRFRIVYTGNLYGGRRDPRPLLRSLRRLADDRRIDPALVEVHFFGPSVDEALAASNETQTREMVQIHDAVSRERSIAEQARANVLLALNWDHPAEAGTYTGKIFEYLSTGRPIIAVGGPPGVLSDLLRSTGGGEHFDSEATELIDRHVLMLYEQWRAGASTPGADPQKLAPYTWRAVSKTVARVLEQACSTRRAR